VVHAQGEAIVLRDSTDPSGSDLRIGTDEFRTFVHRARDGEFDDLCGPRSQNPGLSPREEHPPVSQVDAEDRLSVRVERNPQWYARQVRYEDHRDSLRTRQMWRDLVFSGGLMAVSAVIAYMLKEGHFATADAVRFGIVTYVSSLGGTGIYRLIALFTEKLPNSRPTRDPIDRDSDRPRL
jgi:hypothetical protein